MTSPSPTPSPAPSKPLPVLTYNPATKNYCVMQAGIPIKSTRDPVAALAILRKESNH